MHLLCKAARARAISKGGNAVKAMTSAVVQAREEEEDLMAMRFWRF